MQWYVLGFFVALLILCSVLKKPDLTVNSQLPEKPGPVALITGTSRGLGLALKHMLERQGYRVYGVSRSDKTLDLTDPDSIDRLAQNLQRKTTHLDLLIHNAGILGTTKQAKDSTSRARILHEVLDTNVLGPYLLTTALIPLLHADSWIVHISSTNGSWQSFKQPQTSDAYALSKLILNALTQRWAHQGLHCISVHPGLIRTSMHAVSDTRSMISAEEAAYDIVQLLKYPTRLTSGTFVDRHGHVLSW